MSISYISGRMLKDNLERDTDLSIATDIVYVDVINGRLGVKNISPNATLSVTGTAEISSNITSGNITTGVANINTLSVAENATINGTLNIVGNITGNNLTTNGIASVANILISSATPGSIIYTDASRTLSSTNKLMFDGTNLILAGSASIGNIQVNGTTITSNTNISISSNGDIELNPNDAGLVTVKSSKGLVLPVGGTAQRPNGVIGTLRYNTDTNVIEMFSGSTWTTINHAPFSTITTQVITGDNETTTFTLENSTTASAVIVVIGGTVQQPNVAYTVSGNQITFSEAPLSTDEVVVRFISETATVSAVTDDTGTTYFKADNANLLGVVNSTTVLQVSSNKILNVTNAHSIQLPVYTVSQANALPNKALSQLIYVSNGDSGNPCLAVYDGTSWRRVLFGETISA